MAKIFPPQFDGNKVSSPPALLTKSDESIAITKAQVQNLSDQNKQNIKRGGLRFKTLAKVLAISIFPLAVLIVEITTYYYASQSFEQIEDDKQATLKKPKLLLPMLFLSTGAAVSAAMAALWANRIIRSTKTSSQIKSKTELTEQIKLITKATNNIHTSLNPENIFKTAVQEARIAIAAERVVIYSLEEPSQGKIIAEAVDSHYPRALGTIIDESCFNDNYREEYQNGRITAIDDIYRANLTDCYLSQLEPFAVKANLVVPILSKDKLIGLLIAHYCSSPHTWQQAEIEIMEEITLQIGLALDNIKLLTTSALLQQQKEAATKQIKLLTNATKEIRAADREMNIFSTAVQEARKAIAADRVVFYSLEEQSQGKVLAESVDSRYPQALGAIIDDPCLHDRYLEKYQNGRVRATNDIYQANLTDCHLSQLEPFAVKANLVTPILSQGKLIGLLIAHHCSAPHAWQQSEIDVMVEIALQIGLVLDNIKLLKTSALLQQQKETETRLIQSLTKATDRIRTSLQPKDIFFTAVQEARKAIAAERVVVYSLDEQSEGKVIAESVDSRYPQSLEMKVKDPCFETFYLEKYQDGRVKAIDDIYQANLTDCHLSQLEPFAVKANLVVPILTKDKLIGLLIAHHCSAPHAWQQSEIEVMVQIAKQVGFAIDNSHLLAEVTQISQAFLEQLPAVADFAQVAIANARQAQIQVRQTSQTIKAGCEIANQTVSDLSDIQENITQTITKIKYLGKSSQKISQLVTLIDHLATQINLQGMNMLIKASKTEEIPQTPLTAPIAQAMESLRKDLAEATTELQSFVSNIETEVDDLGMTMKAKTEKVVRGSDLVEETLKKLNQIDTVTAKMSVLLGNIIDAAGKGVQTSTSTSQAIMGTTNLLPHNVEQSSVMADSFNKLVEVYQQVEDTYEKPKQT